MRTNHLFVDAAAHAGWLCLVQGRFRTSGKTQASQLSNAAEDAHGGFAGNRWLALGVEATAVTDLWRRGQHVRSIYDLQPEPFSRQDDWLGGPILPRWAEAVLFGVILIVCLALLIFGITHPLGAHS